MTKFSFLIKDRLTNGPKTLLQLAQSTKLKKPVIEEALKEMGANTRDGLYGLPGKRIYIHRQPQSRRQRVKRLVARKQERVRMDERATRFMLRQISNMIEVVCKNGTLSRRQA